MQIVHGRATRNQSERRALKHNGTRHRAIAPHRTEAARHRACMARSSSLTYTRYSPPYFTEYDATQRVRSSTGLPGSEPAYTESRYRAARGCAWSVQRALRSNKSPHRTARPHGSAVLTARCPWNHGGFVDLGGCVCVSAIAHVMCACGASLPKHRDHVIALDCDRTGNSSSCDARISASIDFSSCSTISVASIIR